MTGVAEMAAESQMIVIFGSTGDLAKRKLIPALYRLLHRGELTENSPIVCLGRRDYSQAEFIEHLEFDSFIQDGEPDLLGRLAGMIYYRLFDIGDSGGTDLQALLHQIRHETGCSTNGLYYLALPTTAFFAVAGIIEPLVMESGWKRVVFEKPFGEDLESAERLNQTISSVLKEDQIFRVDHYLGKELVQNILFLRFANEIFSCSWNRDAIDHVQITVSESLGVEDRAGYYDQSGAIRDMVQNHLLQLLSFVAMEPPHSGHPNAVRDEAARVMQQLRLPVTDDVVVGQYAGGRGGDQSVVAYREEEGVPADSSTETFVALQAWIDSPRWFGVPFYLRTGKRLARRYAEINVVFKQHHLEGLVRHEEPNTITIRIQPDEGIALAFNVRRPGDTEHSESVLMDFCHHCHFGPNTPEAYESIMSSVLKGDPILFTRWDWLRASWSYIDELRAVCPPVVTYPAGSAGPGEAGELLSRNGRAWL
jgi:glucose-6-phosphate 1-dehydrogenase